MHKLLTRLFLLEEINGNHICPTYLYRWTLLTCGKLFSVYLHKFVGNDWAGDLHDHPKRFISIGLRGRYTEITEIDTSNVMPPYKGQLFSTRIYRAPWVRTFPAEHKHRLIGPTPERPCWTLVIMLRATRAWGLWSRGAFIPWRQYVGSDEARKNADCA